MLSPAFHTASGNFSISWRESQTLPCWPRPAHLSSHLELSSAPRPCADARGSRGCACGFLHSLLAPLLQEAPGLLPQPEGFTLGHSPSPLSPASSLSTGPCPARAWTPPHPSLHSFQRPPLDLSLSPLGRPSVHQNPPDPVKACPLAPVSGGMCWKPTGLRQNPSFQDQVLGGPCTPIIFPAHGCPRAGLATRGPIIHRLCSSVSSRVEGPCLAAFLPGLRIAWGEKVNVPSGTGPPGWELSVCLWPERQ